MSRPVIQAPKGTGRSGLTAPDNETSRLQRMIPGRPDPFSNAVELVREDNIGRSADQAADRQGSVETAVDTVRAIVTQHEDRALRHHPFARCIREHGWIPGSA